MLRKRFVVLANSVKHDPARCIAGVEIEGETAGKICFGRWIRPVSRSGEGELNPAQTALSGGGQPRCFDIVEIECEKKCDDPSQPENWLIREGSSWVRTATLGPSILPDLAEEPDHLWLQPATKADRVTPEYLVSSPPRQSLYLLRLQNAVIAASDHKRRLQFRYHGVVYNLAITDPTVAARYSSKTPVIAECFACISLAPRHYNQFLGCYFHYKLVAALLG